MAKTREEVCRFYIAFGECQKGREAGHKGYCQTCGKYYPRSRSRHLNKKKAELHRIKAKEIFIEVQCKVGYN